MKSTKCPTNSTKKKQRSAKRKREERKEELSTMKSMVQALHEPEPVPVEKEVEKEDDDFVFAQYLLREMRQITDKRQKAILRNKFQNIIFETHKISGKAGLLSRST